MTFKTTLRNGLRSLGVDLVRFTPAAHPLARRKRIFESLRIDTVIDVGANVGQFALQVRQDLGFKGRILSFEPLSSAFRVLSARSRGDADWKVFPFALGDQEERREINVAENSGSSSFLSMLPAHLRSAPESAYVGTETIAIKTLDSLFAEEVPAPGNLFLKIDTQGFERRVLRGAERSLPHIHTVQLEMSLVPLYNDESLFLELCTFMQSQGYTLIAIENGFSDAESGQLLQIDGIFHK